MGEPHESIPLPQHHTPPPNHVVILPVCSSKLRPLSAIIIIPTTFLGGCGTKEEYACEKMGIDRNSCCEPQDLGHRGPDQSIDLVASLKSRLNIPDMPMGGFAAGPAAPAAAPVEEEEAAPVQQEKTLFNLKLMSFETGSKPKLMKEGVPKEEAEKIVATLKELGGVVVME